MNLRTLFALPIAVILVVTLSLAGMVAGQGWLGLVRGKEAVEAVERMRLILVLQTGLRAERVVTNLVLGVPPPLAEPLRRRFETARLDTDLALVAAAAELRDAGQAGAAPTDHTLDMVKVRLDAVRGLIDLLLARDLKQRTLAELDAVMPRMLAVYQPLDRPLEHANLAVTTADESLSGLLIEDRLAEALRDHVGLVAAVLLPPFDKGEQPSAAALDRVRYLLARAASLTRLLSNMMEIAGATEQIRQSMADLMSIDVTGILDRLQAQASEPPRLGQDSGPLLPQQLLVPWGQRINQLRAALMCATVERVTARQIQRETRFDLLMTAFGAVMVAVDGIHRAAEPARRRSTGATGCGDCPDCCW